MAGSQVEGPRFVRSCVSRIASRVVSQVGNDLEFQGVASERATTCWESRVASCWDFSVVRNRTFSDLGIQFGVATKKGHDCLGIACVYLARLRRQVGNDVVGQCLL